MDRESEKNHSGEDATNGDQLPALHAAICSVTADGSRILNKDDVILALMDVGLGPKLVNECLRKLGFPIAPFPSQNGEARNGERQTTSTETENDEK